MRRDLLKSRESRGGGRVVCYVAPSKSHYPMKTFSPACRSLAIAFASLVATTASRGAEAQAPLRVALYDDAGSFGQGIPRAMELIGKEPGMKLSTITAEEIRKGKLGEFDVVLFTGGSGSKQGGALQPEGVKTVADFVKKGGGYVGICGGAFLACDGFSWSTNIINAKVISNKWKRGKATLQLELTDEGKKVFPALTEKFDCLYHNGPVVKPAGNELAAYTPLAYFRTEVAENDTPAGIMVNTPAIAEGICGEGHVIMISPHPEQTPGLETVIVQAVKRVAPKAHAVP